MAPSWRTVSGKSSCRKLVIKLPKASVRRITPFTAPSASLGRGSEAFVVGDLLSHAGGLPALGKPGSHGRKNVPAVKRLAEGLKKIMLCIRVPDDQSFLLAFIDDG